MDQDGRRFPAVGFSVISAPTYCTSEALGSLVVQRDWVSCGLWRSGRGPPVAEPSDQYITSALITVPAYQQHWSLYRLELAAGGQRMAVAAPAPANYPGLGNGHPDHSPEQPLLEPNSH